LHTRLKASCIGSLAAQILREKNRKPIGTVTSVFPNSLYVRTINDELLFVANRSLKSPITINIEPTVNLQQLIKPQEQVSGNAREILLGREVSVDLTEAASYAPPDGSSREVGQLSRIREAVRMIALILRVVDATGSVLDETSVTHKTAAEFAHDGILALREGDEDQFRTRAESLVGLGTGFTPSGDDMLGGFLVSYNSLAEKLKRSRFVLDFSIIEKRTNWISAKLLDYMQRLLLDEQLAAIVESQLSDAPDDLVRGIETILPRGHTSGLDIATGAVLGLAAAHDIASGDTETEIVTEKLEFKSTSN